MGIRRILYILCALFMLTGCKKALEHPELADPIYNDLKKQTAKTFSDYKNKQKDVAAAKKAFEDAPIRTGQRLEAHDDYFVEVNAAQKLAEKYRYLALKTEVQKKRDLAVYPKFFKNNIPWPDMDAVADYETEKHLADAPREWSPENRIKERSLAQEKAKKPAPPSNNEE